MSFTFDHSWKLAATPERVFAALTVPAELSVWFAEHADVGAGIGEPYAFWGRHSLETATRELATQRITQWANDVALAYSWEIAGVETQVVIALAAEDEACRLTMSHAVHGTLPYPREQALIDDHWRFAMGNLQAQLAGGVGIVLPDFTDEEPVVRQVVLVDSPRERVFRTLITPALVNEWFGSKDSVIEPRAGGRYALGWSYQVDDADVTGGPSRILEFVQNERLVLDWPDWRGDPTVPVQQIAFDLESVGEQTRVTFVHSGFTRTTDISDYPFGWVWFLSQLQVVALAHHKAMASGEA